MSYDIILIDPPWTYTNKSTESGYKYQTGAALQYDLLTDDEIFALELPLARPGIVFLWATGPRLDAAVHALEHWGLHYRGMGFVWVKTTQAGVPIGAMGVRPSIVKPLTEFVLCGSNIKAGRPLPLSSESVTQTIFAPRREHSRKPDAVLDAIDTLYPNASKLEMFSRGVEREGWTLHGNQIGKYAT